MQEKIDNLKERIDNISNIIGENDLIKEKDKSQFRTINDIISHIKSKILDNNTISSETLNKSKSLLN